MDEKNENVTTNEGLTEEQRELLTQFAARRAARLAVASGRAPEQSELEARLHEMDEAFAAHPDRDSPLVQENHELRRYTAILEEAVRALMAGELVADTRQ
ncbi:hypothetical protein PV387_04475 [Streptomyces sp. ME02-6987-2C]|uniref:hypothetical protein n=1 Tax=unclassified Streptomyces TaxID=2593676 RepID=UPI00087C28CF|nr:MULTISPECIES: hypothetical protein [unclassified Streptomyces]MDX3365287.1 hypothetical protein [Streptomyces sp. ME02-6987-2C]MDX3422715.1 hypothetical protein [Streptomyces sp. ME02-6985-2c]REH20609.1 hypothetical protein BX268_2392 [Streptomyces sp. 2221.1]SDT30042.1 hypothetical protein SAMN05428941_2387 [Streptomyces sp. 2114.2]